MERMDAEEWTYWMAKARCRPIGETALDWHFATLKTLIANQWRGSKDKAIKPEDLLLGRKKEKPVEELTPEEIRERAMALVRALGGGE